MQIYKPALDNLKDSSASGPVFATLVEAIGEQIEATGAQTAYAELKLGYINPDTPEDQMPKSGDYIPEVVIRLIKV